MQLDNPKTYIVSPLLSNKVVVMIIMVPKNKISKIMSRLTSLAHRTQGTTKKPTSIHYSQVKNSFFSQSFSSIRYGLSSNKRISLRFSNILSIDIPLYFN